MTLFHEACQVCGPREPSASTPLFKCSRCHAVLYCGRDHHHQSADFEAHKETCRRIKKLRAALAKEDHAVRNAREDEWTPANAFETHAGRFRNLLSTRPYMRAKLELIRALSVIPSRTAIEAALAEANDSLRLCRTDNQGIREIVAPLMLMLGQFQDAYDFIKWQFTTGSDPQYD